MKPPSTIFNYAHDRKMNLLNQAVYALIKIQDRVYRLLHEGLGGDLVDTSKSDWEERNLRRTPILKGLEAKRASRALAQADFDTIMACARHSPIRAQGRHCADIPGPSDAPYKPVRRL
jgi:hypothetical protein